MDLTSHTVNFHNCHYAKDVVSEGVSFRLEYVQGASQVVSVKKNHSQTNVHIVIVDMN